MQVTTTQADNEFTIKIQGSFNFRIHRQFRDAYDGKPADMRFVIDLHQVDFVDSSALGMLLLLREYAGGDKSNISIINAHPNVLEVLLIAQFSDLFQIS